MSVELLIVDLDGNFIGLHDEDVHEYLRFIPNCGEHIHNMEVITHEIKTKVSETSIRLFQFITGEVPPDSMISILFKNCRLTGVGANVQSTRQDKINRLIGEIATYPYLGKPPHSMLLFEKQDAIVLRTKINKQKLRTTLTRLEHMSRAQH